jgi:ethanolamine ammonia-lyase small subunit
MTNEAIKNLEEASDAMSTHEIMKWLNDAERDRFVKLQETFESDGWKILREYAQAQVAMNGIAGANAKTWEENRVAYGTRSAWDSVSRLEDEFMNAFELSAREAQQSQAESIQED